MATPASVTRPASSDVGALLGSQQSAVSWPAIVGGATVAAAVTILLLTLGSGIGLSSVSPWRDVGASAASFAIGAAIWLIIVQWISAGFGGYIAGRLRTRWTGVEADETFFRDTAHGFVAWSVATLFTVIIVSSAGSALVGGAARTAGSAASAAVQGASQAGATSSASDVSAGLVDTLFRPAQPTAEGDSSGAKIEAGRILVTSLANGSMSAIDRAYLSQLAAVKTGISQQDAEKRVDAMITQAKAAADKARSIAEEARKASAKLAFFTFFSMLIGAFIASVAAALGGRLRDA
jgi:hypothetical protein